MRAHAAWLAWTLLGCTTGDRSAVPSEASAPASAVPPAIVAEIAPVPDDREGVLGELAPVRGGAVVIVYDVTGPAGISGTLELLVAHGGYRRDNWRVTLPLTDGTREIRGSRVHTPELIWRGDDDEPGRTTAARLGTDASAIAALPAAQRERVIEEIRDWRRELARARAEDPGSTERIADVECTRVRAGAGEVCTWEELGLPLRYRGPAFEVTARHIEHGAQLGPHAFDIPDDAVAVPRSHSVAPQLTAIADGDRAEILRLLRPEQAVLPELVPGA